MSAASTSKCLFCTFARSTRQAPSIGRNFSSSSRQLARKPRFESVKVTKAKINRIPTIKESYLEQNFTPEQQAAIKAANALVNNDNIKQVDKLRHPWSPNYVDDFTEVDPSMDHPVRAPWKNMEETPRLKTEEEFDEEFYELMKNLPDDDEAAVEAWKKYDQNMRLTVGKEESERNPRSAEAPDLLKLSKEQSQTKASKTKDGDKNYDTEITPELLRVMQVTGLNKRQINRLRIKTIHSHRVANQTRLGKIYKRYSISVAGNGNGLVGIGEAKSEDSMVAKMQSQYRAIRNMRPILRYENRTIFGEVDAKVGATELELYARPPGFGLRCQHLIYEICKAAGITDIAARVTRAKNPMNTAKGTLQALLSQKDPEEIAKARGKKLVDVRKVYYANQV